MNPLGGDTAETYEDFGRRQAAGSSAVFSDWATSVAGDPEVLALVDTLPEPKRQPNLVLAAARWHGAAPGPYDGLRRVLLDRWDDVRSTVLARATQTNEVGRCAVLLPVLAALPGPLALLEVGASAGLCLLPDRYGYDYGRVRLHPPSPGEHRPPVFPCRASDTTPIPDEIPRIAWRAGIDLHPIDLHDPEEAAWLETLVWPGNEPRAERLRAAIRIARECPPAVTKGDLCADLRRVAAAAPRNATLVVFHSAVLTYVSAEGRERFTRLVAELGAAWISNEAPRVMPEIAAKLAVAPPASQFLLAVDGDPVALTAPHGHSIEWLP